ncbi:acetyl esterase [Podospora aff. communis PSN243]|uniref:Acetyl esterase n=1 Tax=Podospora aff. communis PSN243 TaxID=3040156 RepID=A0AAV9G7Q3_9PEZI|nr:acetyl esterase [Podospora aff. communis PSN243]
MYSQHFAQSTLSMPITSDIIFDPARFTQESITDETKKLNEKLEAATRDSPTWYDVGAERYREMRSHGIGPIPAPQALSGAMAAMLPSRDPERDIPVRVYRPDNGEPSKGIFLHLHGGGWVLGSHRDQDKLLQGYANGCQMVGVSVGYRLAPEDPWPAGVHDCIDVAEQLVDRGPTLCGAKLMVIGGESAGAHLTVLTAFHLIRSRPQHRLAGLVLNCGMYDLTQTLPRSKTFSRPLVISPEIVHHFIKAFLPDKGIEDRRTPEISPLYENLHRLAKAAPGKKLPPALFICGTEDLLLDDTILMSSRWVATGSETIVKIYPGAPHSFISFPGYGPAQEVAGLIAQFVREKVAEV